MSLAASYSAPSRPPHMTNVVAPSSAARSRLRSTLRSANRRTARSFEVNPPSLKTGALKRLVVTIGITRPVAFERALQAADLLVARGVVGSEGEQVVVVEGEPVGAELGELLDRVHDVERLARRAAERVGAVVADGPEPEGELVGGGGGGAHGDLAPASFGECYGGNISHDPGQFLCQR